MKRIIVYSILSLCFFTSCNSYRQRKKAEKIVENFFACLKQSDMLKLNQLYEGFGNFENCYKSDSAKIISSKYKDGLISVLVHNRYTNGFGKINENDITIYLKDSNSNIQIIDSKGLTDFENNDLYTFAIKTGCITNMDSTDQLILSAIDNRAKKLMLKASVNMYQKLKDEVLITSWNWEREYYTSGASGHGIVKNLSNFTIPNLKYKVTYLDNMGNEITSDDGYVCYDNLQPGESKSFSFYSTYTGGAHQATIELKFDASLIVKYIAARTWTGNEWASYENSDKD